MSVGNADATRSFVSRPTQCPCRKSPKHFVPFSCKQKQHPNHLLTDDFCVKRSLVLQHARQFTTCASCLNAVRTLRLQDHPLLEEGDGGDLRVRPIHTETVDSTSRVLSILSTSGQWMTKLQPQSSKKKKSIRCRAYQKTRDHVDASGWRKVWDAAPAKFKERVATMVPADLEQFTKDHVEFVRFCRRCSANVKEGFHLLMQKDNPDFKLPEGYRTDLFAPLHVVPARDRDSNDASDSTRVVCDVSSVPELINYHTTELVKDEMRHANNEEARCAVCLDLVQQEIRSVVGSLLLWRIRSGWHPFLAEEQSIDLICRVALTCIRGNVAASLQSQLPNVDAPNVVQTKNKKKKKRRNKRNKKKGKGKQKQSNRQVVGFDDAKEAELLKSMGWSSLESDGTAAEACVKGRKKNQTPVGLDSICNVEQFDRDFDFDLGLSFDELEAMKTKLMDTKKERDQQRVALKQAWETCQSSCCKSTKHGKRAGDVCSSKKTFLCA